MFKRLLPILILAQIFAAFPSCVSRIENNLTDKSIETEIETSYLASVYDFTRSVENASGERINLEKEKYKRLSFSIDSLEEDLNKYNLTNIVKLEKTNDITSVSFNINVDNYEDLKTLFPLIENEKVAVYLAKYNKNDSQEEYLDMIDYVFGEEAREDLKKSSVNIKLYSSKKLSNAKNCKIQDNSIELSFPLLDFLLLKKEISFGFEVG